MAKQVRYAIKLIGEELYLRNNETWESDDAFTDDLANAALFETAEEVNQEGIRKGEEVCRVVLDFED